MTPQPSVRLVELNRAIRAIVAEHLHSGVADPSDLREAACGEFTLDDCVRHLTIFAASLAERIAEKRSVFVWASLAYAVKQATLVLDPEGGGLATRRGPLIEFAHAAHASGQGVSDELGAAAAKTVSTRHGDDAFIGGVLICAQLLHVWGEADGQTADEALSSIALWQEGQYGDGVPNEAGATR